MKTMIALALLLLPTLGFAQSTVSQGNGSPSVVEWRVNASANLAAKSTTVCVTNAAGGTAVPTTTLAGRKSIEIQNLGPNAIYCTVDGQAPTVATLGRKIIGNADATWSTDVGPGVTIKCIAATAAQVAGACTMVTEVR